MTQVIDSPTLFQAEFEALLARRGSDPSWLRPIRERGMGAFAELGIPTSDDEEWRFTPLQAVNESRFTPAAPAAVSREQIVAFSYGEIEGPQLVFVNGRFDEGLSDLSRVPNGVELHPLSRVLEHASQSVEAHLGAYVKTGYTAFTALNTALFEEGVAVLIPRNVVVDEPIRVLYLSISGLQPGIAHPRNLIYSDSGSQATVIETYASLDGGVYFNNVVTEVVVKENAILDHYKVQLESKSAVHISNVHLELSRGANFSTHSIGFGGRLVRNDIFAYLGGQGIECTVNGVYHGDGSRIIDNHTAIDHAMPHCNSHEIYKGILDDQSRGVFNGKIFVRLDAQKTDAKQTNQTLLLSEDAQIFTKPQLEIFADDVKCTHGATVGQLSQEQLFYLMSRGLNRADAKSLLVYAFASDIVSRIKVPQVREALDAILLSELPG